MLGTFISGFSEPASSVVGIYHSAAADSMHHVSFGFACVLGTNYSHHVMSRSACVSIMAFCTVALLPESFALTQPQVKL